MNKTQCKSPAGIHKWIIGWTGISYQCRHCREFHRINRDSLQLLVNESYEGSLNKCLYVSQITVETGLRKELGDAQAEIAKKRSILGGIRDALYASGFILPLENSREEILTLARQRDQLARERDEVIRILERVDQVRVAMARQGRDFFIGTAQRAFPIICEAHDLLKTMKGETE